jgi:hypothetical protein
MWQNILTTSGSRLRQGQIDMKNERKEKHGVLVIDYGPLIHPSEEIDPLNPFVRKKVERIATTRKCKICGTEFVLHGDYDPENQLHDLCDDCILDSPAPQEYPDKTFQIEQSEMDAAPLEFMENGEEMLE